MYRQIDRMRVTERQNQTDHNPLLSSSINNTFKYIIKEMVNDTACNMMVLRAQ